MSDLLHIYRRTAIEIDDDNDLGPKHRLAMLSAVRRPQTIVQDDVRRGSDDDLTPITFSDYDDDDEEEEEKKKKKGYDDDDLGESAFETSRSDYDDSDAFQDVPLHYRSHNPRSPDLVASPAVFSDIDMDDDEVKHVALDFEEADISVCDAHKSYDGNKAILDGLNMTVRRGEIYGLLGPSGCGKTTLLSCLVGTRRLNDGDIEILGSDPSDLIGRRFGYMPQELVLITEMSVLENLEYYGLIYGMERKALKQRCNFLLSFLDLPMANRIVKRLSGGQKRRVSLAVALIHNPQLLILDEPTVGVDPLLRHNIWSHLVKLARREHKTIVITTHYIEEASRADTVGFMRDGRLMVEESPKRLLTLYRADNLEDIFLALCMNRNNNDNDDTKDQLNKMEKEEQKRRSIKEIEYAVSNRMKSRQSSVDAPPPYEATMTPPMYDENMRGSPTPWVDSFTRVETVFAKHMKSVLRNKSSLLMTVLLPVVQVVCMVTALKGDPRHLKLALVNHELSQAISNNCSSTSPTSFLASVSSNSSKVCNGNLELSCRFLSFLADEEALSIVTYSDDQSAIEAVRRGEAWGILDIPSNFSFYLTKRLKSSSILGSNSKTMSLKESRINVELDRTNEQIFFFITNALAEAYEAFQTSILDDCRLNREASDFRLKLGKPIYGSTKPTFVSFAIPGLLMHQMFYLMMASTAGMIVFERSQGLLQRESLAGVATVERIFAFIGFQLFTLTLKVSVFLGLAIGLFEIPCHGSVALLATLMIAHGLCGIVHGFMVAHLVDEMADVTSATFSYAGGLSSFNGLVWPIEAVPQMINRYCWLLPTALPIQAARDVMNRGLGLEPASSVGSAFVSIAFWTTVGFAVAVVVGKRKASKV